MKDMINKIKKLKILVVEDETNLQKLIKNFFDNFHTNYDIAEDGVVALEYLAKNKYDILIADIVMPNMNGITLIQKIREEKLDIKIIVISANAQMSYLEDLEKLNIDKFMPKPFDIMELLRVINDMS